MGIRILGRLFSTGMIPNNLKSCGFPAIPRYLEMQQFPEDAIQEARVTHVMAQDAERAHHIAASAARIGTVVRKFDDMIGEIDGVLLARDDAVQHAKFATPFLEAGLPIYVDKPLALSVRDADRLIELQRYPGQLFSCSALRYAPELNEIRSNSAQLGRLRYVHGVAPNAWDTYAAHLIEPFLCMAGHRGAVQQLERCITDGSISVNGQPSSLGFKQVLQRWVFQVGRSRFELSEKRDGVTWYSRIRFVHSRMH